MFFVTIFPHLYLRFGFIIKAFVISSGVYLPVRHDSYKLTIFRAQLFKNNLEICSYLKRRNRMCVTKIMFTNTTSVC
jgi:hypothetical protein